MKYVLFFLLISFSLLSCSDDPIPSGEAGKVEYANAARLQKSTLDVTTWKLIFEDNFDIPSGTFDTTKWSHCPRIPVAWGKYLTSSPDHVRTNGDDLILIMNNKPVPGDDVPYHSGGIETRGKFNFSYGKVEVRAKFNRGQGAWPAIWMMPENNTYGDWPNSGEIDIMEHVNYESIVHQTLHSGSFTSPSGGSKFSYTRSYSSRNYNIYGMEWYEDRIELYVNGSLTATYNKPAHATPAQWPYDQPFYIILNQSGGAGWPGPIIDSTLPFNMAVDWVRVYQEEPVEDPNIVDGATYKLVSAVDDASVLDVYGKRSDNGTKIILWTPKTSGDDNQRWILTPLSDGYYKFTSKLDASKVLEVNKGSTANGTQVQIWQDNGGNSQKWKLHKTPDGYYTLSPASALSTNLDVNSGSSIPGTKIQIWGKNDSKAQKFKLIRQD